MHRKTAAALGALALLLSACNDGTPTGSVAQAPEPTASQAAPTLSPTALPTAEPTAEPTAVPTKAAPKPTLPPYDVKAVKTKLTALKYYIGAIDTERGSTLRSAVMAFQKVNGLNADGGVGPKTLAALNKPVVPKLKGTGSGVRVEVDLTKQVLYVAKDNVITRILPVSSGNGKKYLTKSGYLATALSPVGYYKIQRRIIGERKADLGTLYDPQYFYRGWAIHGSNSVPAYPASHGCTRVTRTDAKWLLKHINVGTAVYVYGGKFTFPAGSSAPGTDDPGGDTPDTTPTASPTPSATPTPTPSATPSPAPTPVPTILPTPSP